MRKRIYHAFPTTALVLGFLVAVNINCDAFAQTESGSIIVVPEAPRHVEIHGDLGDIANETAQSFNDNIGELQKNLGILYNLNSASNQSAINALGKNYANIPALGDNFGTAIHAIDTGQLADNSDKLAGNIKGSLGKYGETIKNLTDKVSAAVASSPYSAQNLPNQAQAADIEVQAKKMAADQAQLAMPVLGVKMEEVMKLDNNVSVLNSHVVSITKTYLNLLKLANEPPSVIASTPDLGTELGTLNNLAFGDMRVLGSLNGDMKKINDGYTALNKHDVPVKNALDSINNSMENMTLQLSASNTSMGATLGQPAVDPNAKPAYPTAEPMSPQDVAPYITPQKEQ